MNSTVGCSDLLIPVLFHDQDQRDPLYNDVVNDNIATLAFNIEFISI